MTTSSSDRAVIMAAAYPAPVGGTPRALLPQRQVDRRARAVDGAPRKALAHHEPAALRAALGDAPERTVVAAQQLARAGERAALQGRDHAADLAVAAGRNGGRDVLRRWRIGDRRPGRLRVGGSWRWTRPRVGER